MKKNWFLRLSLSFLCVLWVRRERVRAGLSRPYTHYADGEDLPATLINFARSQGMGANIPPRCRAA